jgi:hypothetical protein
VPPVRVGVFDRVRIEHLDELPRVFAEQLLHKAARKLWSSLSCFSTLWRVGDHWFTNHQLCERLCIATAIVHCTMMRACACLDALLRKPHCRLDLLLGQPLRRRGHRTLTASLPVALLRALNQTAFDNRFLSRRNPHAPRRSPEHAHVRHVRTLWGTVRPTHTPSSDGRSCATAPPDRMECSAAEPTSSLSHAFTH